MSGAKQWYQSLRLLSYNSSHYELPYTQKMTAKFEIEKFNGSNFSLWKLKMKASLRKDNCLIIIEERFTDITDDKWKAMDDNVIANLHLALTDSVLSSVVERKTTKEIWDDLTKLYEIKSLHNKYLGQKLTIYRAYMPIHPTFRDEGLTIIS